MISQKKNREKASKVAVKAINNTKEKQRQKLMHHTRGSHLAIITIEECISMTRRTIKERRDA